MGWKLLKERYGIGHTVQVTDEGICIGSPYVHNLIVLDFTGRVVRRSELIGGNDDLHRYVKSFEADPQRVKETIDEPDCFTDSITVYTYDGGTIIEKKCEKLGWPNCTHDGELMYENTFSTDRAEIVARAIENAKCGIELTQEAVESNQKRLDDSLARLKRLQDAVASLEQQQCSTAAK